MQGEILRGKLSQMLKRPNIGIIRERTDLLIGT